jgi:hypothetical protein
MSLPQHCFPAFSPCPSYDRKSQAAIITCSLSLSLSPLSIYLSLPSVFPPSVSCIFPPLLYRICLCHSPSISLVPVSRLSLSVTRNLSNFVVPVFHISSSVSRQFLRLSLVNPQRQFLSHIFLTIRPHPPSLSCVQEILHYQLHCKID